MGLEYYYHELYGDSDVVDKRYRELRDIIEKAKKERSPKLKEQDLCGNYWYLSQETVGMMVYIDKFSGDLVKFEKKIDYLVELGITYVHFISLLKSRKGNNDGGYAVTDYLNVDEKFGSTEQFKRIVSLLKERGIRTCIDFVLNHTAKEHEWVYKSKREVSGFENMYYMYDNYDIPQKFESTMTEIFPEIAPGNFTYYDDIKKYVMTRFYEFQWDLNYTNPLVFNKIAETMLALANMGIDILRLDAIPYIWKQLHTRCMNLEQVHIILKMYQMIINEVCPSVVFKGEAIVEPREIVKYFGTYDERECQIMYNASYMVLLWNSLATRDVRLMQRSLNKRYSTPVGAVWVNYARCHDDIGWGFEEDILRELGFDPFYHKQFITKYMVGQFPGSFSRGELYQFNPATMDARNSGTMASMCGLEQGLEEHDDYKTELAVKRILLLNAMIISYTGIPMLYSGDEIGQLNYWDYKKDPHKKDDSRWLHRGPMDWKKAKYRKDKSTVEGYLFSKIKQMIEIRKSSDLFSSTLPSESFDTWNKGVFAFNKKNRMLVFGNFTEYQQTINPDCMGKYQMYGVMTDMIQGKKVNMNQDIILGPYEYLWLAWQ